MRLLILAILLGTICCNGGTSAGIHAVSCNPSCTHTAPVCNTTTGQCGPCTVSTTDCTQMSYPICNVQSGACGVCNTGTDCVSLGGDTCTAGVCSCSSNTANSGALCASGQGCFTGTGGCQGTRYMFVSHSQYHPAATAPDNFTFNGLATPNTGANAICQEEAAFAPTGIKNLTGAQWVAVLDNSTTSAYQNIVNGSKNKAISGNLPISWFPAATPTTASVVAAGGMQQVQTCTDSSTDFNCIAQWTNFTPGNSFWGPTNGLYTPETSSSVDCSDWSVSTGTSSAAFSMTNPAWGNSPTTACSSTTTNLICIQVE